MVKRALIGFGLLYVIAVIIIFKDPAKWSTVGPYIALVLGVAYIFGFRLIFRGEWKPSRFSWFIWVFIDIMILATTKASAGWNEGQWLIFWYMICSLMVAVLSLRFGVNEWKWVDTAAITGAIASAIVWKLVGSSDLALVLGTLAHFCGYIPTFRKTWVRPADENKIVWSIFCLANILGILGVSGLDFSKWTWQAVLFAAYDLIMCLIVILLSIRKLKTKI